MKALTILLRLSLGILFLTSGWTKLYSPRAFAESIQAYQILPEKLVTLSAIVLPWLEALVGFGLLTGLFVAAAALLSGTLSGLFFLALSSVLARGLDIDCGCWTGAETPVDWRHLALNAAMIGASVLLYRKAATKPPVETASRTLVESGDQT